MREPSSPRSAQLITAAVVLLISVGVANPSRATAQDQAAQPMRTLLSSRDILRAVIRLDMDEATTDIEAYYYGYEVDTYYYFAHANPTLDPRNVRNDVIRRPMGVEALFDADENDGILRAAWFAAATGRVAWPVGRSPPSHMRNDAMYATVRGNALELAKTDSRIDEAIRIFEAAWTANASACVPLKDSKNKNTACLAPNCSANTMPPTLRDLLAGLKGDERTNRVIRLIVLLTLGLDRNFIAIPVRSPASLCGLRDEPERNIATAEAMVARLTYMKTRSTGGRVSNVDARREHAAEDLWDQAEARAEKSTYRPNPALVATYYRDNSAGSELPLSANPWSDVLSPAAYQYMLLRVVDSEIVRVAEAGRYYVYDSKLKIGLQLVDHSPNQGFRWATRAFTAAELGYETSANYYLPPRSSFKQQLIDLGKANDRNYLSTHATLTADGLLLDSDASRDLAVEPISDTGLSESMPNAPTVGAAVTSGSPASPKASGAKEKSLVPLLRNLVAKRALQAALKAIAKQIVAKIPEGAAIGALGAMSSQIIDGTFIFFYSSDIATEDLKTVRDIDAQREREWMAQQKQPGTMATGPGFGRGSIDKADRGTSGHGFPSPASSGGGASHGGEGFGKLGLINPSTGKAKDEGGFSGRPDVIGPSNKKN